MVLCLDKWTCIIYNSANDKRDIETKIYILRKEHTLKMEEQIYKIDNIKSFEPVHIFDCGQCFRWDAQPDGSYTGVFKGNVMNVKKEGNTVIFKGICKGDIREICIDYFDLERNYEEIKEQLSKIDNNVKTSVSYIKYI